MLMCLAGDYGILTWHVVNAALTTRNSLRNCPSRRPGDSSIRLNKVLDPCLLSPSPTWLSGGRVLSLARLLKDPPPPRSLDLNPRWRRGLCHEAASSPEGASQTTCFPTPSPHGDRADPALVGLA